MRQIHDNQYAKFTPEERVRLTIAALSRGDEPDASRLWQTSPRYTYRAHDLEYTQRVNVLILLGTVFFEKCVWHYNRIKKADMFIICSKQDLEYEEREGFADFAN